MQPEGEGDEVLDAELLRTKVEDRVAQECRELVFGPFFPLGLGAGQGLEGVAHHLAALAEGSLDDGLEEGFVAAEGLAAVPAQPDDGGLDLGRRGETAGADGEEIFDVIPGLQQDRQDAVGLRAGPFRDALGHFFLDHADDLRDLLPVVQDLEENLRGNVVGEVADDGKGPLEMLGQLHLEEILLQQAALHVREMGAEVFDGFPVDLHQFEVHVAALQQILRQHAHARSDFQHRGNGTGRDFECIYDRFGDSLIGQKMLAQGLLCPNFHFVIFRRRGPATGNSCRKDSVNHRKIATFAFPTKKF